VFDGRRAWSKTHLGESPLNKAEAHRLAHKLRDPKFYSVRTKRAVNSGSAGPNPIIGAWRVVEGHSTGSGSAIPWRAIGPWRETADEARSDAAYGATRWLKRALGEPGVRDHENPCDMFSPGKPTHGGCQGDGHYLCHECSLFDDRTMEAP